MTTSAWRASRLATGTPRCRVLKHALQLKPDFDGADEAKKKLTIIGV